MSMTSEVTTIFFCFQCRVAKLIQYWAAAPPTESTVLWHSFQPPTAKSNIHSRFNQKTNWTRICGRCGNCWIDFFFHLCPWSPHITSSVWECEGYTEARKQVKKWLRLTVNYLRRFTWMNMEVYTENIDTLIISYHTTRKPRIWQWHSNTSFIVIRSIKEHKQSLLLRCSRVNSFPHSK